MRVQPSAYPLYLVTYYYCFTIHRQVVFRFLGFQVGIIASALCSQNMLRSRYTTCLYKQWLSIFLYLKSFAIQYNPSGLWPSCPLGFYPKSEIHFYVWATVRTSVVSLLLPNRILLQMPRMNRVSICLGELLIMILLFLRN